jgi:hypothetical protein
MVFLNKLTIAGFDFFKELRQNNRIIDGVDVNHGLVNSMQIVDARHL